MSSSSPLDDFFPPPPPQYSGCEFHRVALGVTPRDRSPLVECGSSPDPTTRLSGGEYSSSNGSSSAGSLSPIPKNMSSDNNKGHNRRPPPTHHFLTSTPPMKPSRKTLRGANSDLNIDRGWLNQSDKNRSDSNLTELSWLYVTPAQRLRPRDCDEVPEEFVRAGIGLCFEGNNVHLLWDQAGMSLFAFLKLLLANILYIHSEKDFALQKSSKQRKNFLPTQIFSNYPH